MLDFAGTIAITAVMVVAINAAISAVAVSRLQRIAAALIVGLWVGLAAASANAGWLAVATPFPIIGLYVAAPLLGIAALSSFSPTWRAALEAKGHRVEPAPRRWGNMQAVFRSNQTGTAHAASDPRGAD